ncbi:dihydrofolate reductase family protein [Mucilaginibacter sp. HD30]
MGKVIVLISVTPDGFADAENVIANAEFFEFTHGLMANADVAAFGRLTFEMFQDRWPGRLINEDTPGWVRKMAKALHHIPKIVFSSTLKNTTWHNSSIVDQLNTDYINAFKRDNKGALLTFGSLSLIEELTKMNLVDDYYFNILPVLPGKGHARLFSKLNSDLPLGLKFIDSINFASGAHVMHYQSDGANP